MKSNSRMLMGTPPVNVGKASKLKVPKMKTLSSLKLASNQSHPQQKSTSIGSFESNRELLRKYLIFKDEPLVEQKPNSNGRLTSDQLKQFKDNDDRFMITERFIFLLGLLYTVLAVVAVVFYENKRALYLIALPCQLHVFKHGLLKCGKKCLAISSSIANLLIHLAWLIFVLSVTIYYILKDPAAKDKIEFTDEIILHVGLVFYSPFVLYSCYISIKMISQKIEFLDVYEEINATS